MTTDLNPDPTVIGGVPKAPLAFLPRPARLFADRAKRFVFLADSGHRLAPYLTFLAALTGLQGRLLAELPAIEPIGRDRVDLARANRMPPVDRAALATDPLLHDTLTRLCDAAQSLDMPEPARLALQAVIAGDAADRHWLVENILADRIPEDSAAPHLFAAAAVQLHMARLVGALNAADLVPISTGICPACGGRPATSSVMGPQGIENVRYATCNCCATQWNEVRIKCLCCGSTKGISYRSVEAEDAVIKAEVCSECDSWVKILYQVKNHSLDPIADDVASLGLDMMMKDTAFRRGGVNAFMAGY
ncbi:formate dehydrogenase accessory protein FdhE [Paracoccus sp. M683]|uniref:formate dehydrogenase accessory protein FdhE n=1 Tax=Paracoccus sp. M683 TaxID=2594268 RepID=UPI00117E8D05|nr:formate dehydrogenase accessory protein FdhE [Paracoccus sp. M683]TRW99539.1 formate dehydrogenase accessory protein FdhE [Paracoccus sp. M683]